MHSSPPQAPRSPPCDQDRPGEEKQVSVIFWGGVSRPLTWPEACIIIVTLEPEGTIRQGFSGSCWSPPEDPATAPAPASEFPQLVSTSSWLQWCSCKGPQSLTIGGELPEGWEIIRLQGFKQQVLDHLCLCALQLLGQRCLSFCKTLLLLSSSSPLPQMSSPMLSHSLFWAPPGSRTAPALEKAALVLPKPGGRLWSRDTVGTGSCHCYVCVPL